MNEISQTGLLVTIESTDEHVVLVIDGEAYPLTTRDAINVASALKRTAAELGDREFQLTIRGRK